MPFPSDAPVEAGSSACTSNPTNASGRRVWVVGLGSPFGDDRVGWEVAARLRDLLSVGAWVHAASDPLVVLDALSAEELIVIDACRGAGAPGSVHRFGWPDPRLAADGGVSSHGVGLAAALELAGALGRLPPRVIVFAIEGEQAGPGAGSSRTLASAVSEVVERVRSELAASDSMPGRMG